jgi:hypothetical protein
MIPVPAGAQIWVACRRSRRGLLRDKAATEKISRNPASLPSDLTSAILKDGSSPACRAGLVL